MSAESHRNLGSRYLDDADTVGGVDRLVANLKIHVLSPRVSPPLGGSGQERRGPSRR